MQSAANSLAHFNLLVAAHVSEPFISVRQYLYAIFFAISKSTDSGSAFSEYLNNFDFAKFSRIGPFII